MIPINRKGRQQFTIPIKRMTIQETGQANQEYPDEDVLASASGDDRAVLRAVLTVNRQDFIRLHRRFPDHSGIVVCTADLDFTGQARRIHEAIEAYDSLADQLIRIYRPGM